MTPGFRILSVLIVACASACIVHTTPASDSPPSASPTRADDPADAVAQPDEPAAAPQATPAPDTADPPADPEPPRAEMKCAAAGPRLAELLRTALPRTTPARQSRLWIYKSGAWQRHVGETLVAEGCLTGEQRARLERLVAAADMKPPPPPEIQCKALPTAETRVALPPRGGAVTFSGPCGMPAHESIHAIEQELRDSVGGGKDLFPELR